MTEIRRVRVPCPLKGESHTERWIERREQIGIPVYRELAAVGNYITNEEALKSICKIFSEQILDWNLVDDLGEPLPKPYQNPEALEKLADVDSDAFLWVNNVIQSTIDKLVEPPEEKS